MINEPTELQSQTDALRILAALISNATDVGLSVAPDWHIPSTGLIAGVLRSQDGSALRVLEEWRHLLGAHGITSWPAVDERGGRRQVWQVTAEYGGMSVQLSADIPAIVTASIATAGIAVAA